MIIFFQEIMMLLFLWLLKLIDGIMEIFSAIAGVGTVSYQGKQVNILDLLIGDSTIGTVFWCIMILAVGLTCLFAIVGLVKNMIANNRQVSGIMGKFFLALLGTLAMLAVVILGILISNAVLKLVNEVFGLNGSTKLSTSLFNACVGNWKKGHSISEFNTDLSVRKIFGSYKKILGIWPDEWKGNGLIDPDSFMYLPALIGSIGLLIALIIACINLAKRIYEIVLLYLVMPVSMSTLPLDDGARFKIWRETFITKMILAYGTVFAVNLFILVLPILTQMKVTGASNFANSIFYIFMLVGGAVLIPAAQQMFARLFGSSEDNGHGSHFLRTAAFGGRMAAVASIGLMAKGIKGGAKLGKKAISRHKGKGGSGGSDDGGGSGGEKYTEENSGLSLGGSDGVDNNGNSANSNEQHSDSQSSQENTDNEKLENQTTGTESDGNNDMAGSFESGISSFISSSVDNKASSEDNSQDKTDITEGAFENGNIKKSTDNSSSKASSESVDNSENIRLENQTTGTSNDGNNDMVGCFESGNGDKSIATADMSIGTSATNSDSSLAASTDSNSAVDTKANGTLVESTDSNSAVVSDNLATGSANSNSLSEEQPSALEQATAIGSELAATSTDSTSAVVTDNNSSAESLSSNNRSERQSTALGSDNLPSGAIASDSKPSAIGAETMDSSSAAIVKSSTDGTSAESTDVKSTAANTENPSSTVLDNNSSAISGESNRYKMQSTTTATDNNSSSANAESSKYSENPMSMANNDSDTATVNADNDKSSMNSMLMASVDGKSIVASLENSKSTTASTDSNTSSTNTESGKYSENPISMASNATDIHTVNAENDKATIHPMSITNTDSKATPISTESGKSSAESTDSKTSSVSTESSKYSESQMSATSTDSKSSLMQTETKPLQSNSDNRNQMPTKNADNKQSVSKKNKKLSDNSDGKYSVSADDADIGGMFE